MKPNMEGAAPVEGFLPGELITEELEARAWTQSDLAEILGRTQNAVSDIITGRTGITVKTAMGLAEAFGTSAQFWLNMESAYRLSLEREKTQEISQRAALFRVAPVREMIKRNWLEPSTNVAVLTQRLKEFFSCSDLNIMPRLPYMARKSTLELTSAQNAWLFRAKQLSKRVRVEPYVRNNLDNTLRQLKALCENEQGVKLVPEVLSKAGIKLLIIEPFPNSKIDGVSFWDSESPVVVLSLRYDRIDSFWYTLMHEIGHIINEDGLRDNKAIIDAELEPGGSHNDKPEYEIRADEFAEDFLVPQDEMKDFITRVHPAYSVESILDFSAKIKVHPGIVVGQLHYKTKEYTICRKLLSKVRSNVAASVLVDGYGQIIPANSN